MSVSIAADTHELSRVLERIQSVLGVAERPQFLLLQLARGVVQQTQARIEREKTSPDGQAWVPWSAPYAATRAGGDSLLVDSRDLLDSFQIATTRADLTVWSELPYAGVHQHGSKKKNIPARPYLGLSNDNLSNIDDWLGGILRAAASGKTSRAKVRK